jgi:hypothetical protein
LRLRHVLSAERRALERIDGDIHLRPGSGADLLANEQHRRFVHLAFADHDRALDRKLTQFSAHRIDSRLVRHLFRAAPAQSRCGHRGPFRYPHDFERQRAPETRVLACGLTRVLAGRLQ